MNLIHGKLYYIYQPKTNRLPHALYKGRYVSSHGKPWCITFEDVYGLQPLEYLGRLNFGVVELFYDVDVIKNKAAQAIEKWKKRALDMILKRIINEDFVWY